MPISTAAARPALAALEQLFTDAKADRAAVVDLFGTSYNGNKLKRLQDNAETFKGKIRTAAATAQQAMTSLQQQANDALNAAHQKDAQSTEYARYVAELTALAPLVALMTPKQAADRLETALNEGRTAQARALVEALSLRMSQYETDTSSDGFRGRMRLRELLERAAAVVVPKDVAKATDQKELIDLALDRWSTWFPLLERRLQQIFDSGSDLGSDYHAGCYSPDNIFKTSRISTAKDFDLLLAAV